MRWFVSSRLFCHRGLGTSQERRNPLTDPVCCHVGAAPCCRFLSLWTTIVHPWRRRSWRPHSHPSRCPSKPPHTCLCLQPEQGRWEVDLSVNRSRRWRRRLTYTLHQGDLPCHGSLDQVWQPGPTSWCTEFIIDFLQMEIICKFRRVGGFSERCWVLMRSYAVCGIFSTRNFQQGNVVIFDLCQSTTCTPEIQAEHPDAHTHSYDHQQKGQADPELRTVEHWGWCRLSIWTKRNSGLLCYCENYASPCLTGFIEVDIVRISH